MTLARHLRKRVRKRGIEYQSRMTQILNVNLRNIFRLVKHVMIVGASGSGKTSALLLFTKLFFDNGETILWRDDTSLEFLSLREVMPWKVFVPNGCQIHYKHPNVEYVEYDPWNMNTLFEQIDRDKGNAVVFDLFSFDMSMFIDFWSRFFYSLYRWKRTRVQWRMALMVDEINDLAPGTRRGYIPRQLALSSNIYFSLKKFRKEGIRLVASTHAYGDVHKPVREAFNYYIFRQMDEESVPDIFSRYAKVVQKLSVREMIILDESKNFNKMEIEEVVKPRKFALKWSGDLRKQTQAKKTELDKWKKRTAILVRMVNDLGISYEDLAKVLGYSTRGGIQQFTVKKISEEDKAKIKAVLEKFAAA